MMATLIALALIFSQLALLAFGGGNTILPEMQRQVVEIHHWMTPREFSALFALSQAAPGPNMMIVPLIGWHVAGWAGFLVTSIAKFGPSSMLTMVALHAWTRFKDNPWRRIIQMALVPVTAGVVAASAAVIAHAADRNALLTGITVLTALLAWRTRLHPLWLLLGGGLVSLAAGGWT